MNFNRVSLKTKAKQLLRKNWGWAVLVTLIFSLTTTTWSTSFVQDEVRDIFNPRVETNQNVQNGDDIDDSLDIGVGSSAINRMRPDVVIRRYKDKVEITVRELMPFYKGSVWALIGLIAMFALLFGAALKIFVLNPIQVGCVKWYLRNREEDKPKMRAVIETFTDGYIRIVGIMFLRDLYTFLWSLLLIIPGIVKSYEYRMIPYLIAENPELTSKEAFEMTRKLMMGNKMDTFVLDLSFLPWILISIIACGILSVLFVAPYMKLTDTELYVCLCQGKEKYESINL